jgi:transcriptional regulator with XRE-family HTH domain
MGKSLDRLNELAAGRMSAWYKEADWYRKNVGWLKRSSRIAYHILSELDEQGISQKELALRMEVSPQYVNKIVKGKENLSLETIWKIEEALGITLISINRNLLYIQPEITPIEISYSKIPLPESLSTTVSEGFSLYDQSTKNNEGAA